MVFKASTKLTLLIVVFLIGKGTSQYFDDAGSSATGMVVLVHGMPTPLMSGPRRRKQDGEYLDAKTVAQLSAGGSFTNSPPPTSPPAQVQVNRTQVFASMISMLRPTSAAISSSGEVGSSASFRRNNFHMVRPEPYPTLDYDPDCREGIPYATPADGGGGVETVCLRLPPLPKDPSNFCFPGEPEVNVTTGEQTGRCAKCPNNSTNVGCVEATYDCGPHGYLSHTLSCVCDEDWYTSLVTQQCTDYLPAETGSSSAAARSLLAPGDTIPGGVMFGPRQPLLSTAEVVIICLLFALIPGWFVLARDLDLR